MHPPSCHKANPLYLHSHPVGYLLQNERTSFDLDTLVTRLDLFLPTDGAPYTFFGTPTSLLLSGPSMGVMSLPSSFSSGVSSLPLSFCRFLSLFTRQRIFGFLRKVLLVHRSSQSTVSFGHIVLLSLFLNLIEPRSSNTSQCPFRSGVPQLLLFLLTCPSPSSPTCGT